MGRLGIAHRAVEDMVIISFSICSRYKPVHATVMAPKNFSTKNKAKPQKTRRKQIGKYRAREETSSAKSWRSHGGVIRGGRRAFNLGEGRHRG